ncbi:hypothetical protein SRRS_19760 [Sporomusa rhizae]|uniref:hypothetical protein n=1 Tax=Sporomusa rhizae TaxID=357999 RepID=UPI00352A2AC4
MRNHFKTTESIVTPLEPRRVEILGDECLIQVRFVESHSHAAGWSYEYELVGEIGKVEKFLVRLKDIEKKS